MKNSNRITVAQVKEIAKEISTRWTFVNHGSYYNCIDTKTGERSNDGGDGNFASYNFICRVETLYLKMIGKDYSYFDWQSQGVDETNERKNYIFSIRDKVVELLCGFKYKTVPSEVK